MSIVNFKFDREKDAFNYWRIAKNKSKIMPLEKIELPEKIIEITKNKEFNECKEEITRFLNKRYNARMIKISVECFQKAWDSIEQEYFKRLEKVTKNKIYVNKITAYLTTLEICPYNLKENWFMVNFFSVLPRVCVTSGHEIMHLHFHHHHWEEIEKEIGYEKTWDLKESLTALLNLEFQDLWGLEDNGHPNHKELRNFIKIQWNKYKDFDILLKECIKYLKK